MNLANILELIRTFINLLYAVGFFSELIVLIIVIYLIYPQTTDLVFFLVGIILNSISNRILKPLFRSLRPKNPVKFLHSEEFPKKIDYTKNNNYYGMPSGHSQNVAYSLTYLYLTIPESPMIKLFSIIIGLLTIFERWWFRNHTILQLIVGVFIGGLFAYLTVLIRKKWRTYKREIQTKAPMKEIPTLPGKIKN